MKRLLLILSLFSVCACSTLSESFTPVSWGSGAYVAVPLGFSDEDPEEGTKVEDQGEGPSRKLSSEKKDKESVE